MGIEFKSTDISVGGYSEQELLDMDYTHFKFQYDGVINNFKNNRTNTEGII